jgi:ASC-1-like (ASCH) protein
MCALYTKHLSEPFISFILQKTKIVEGRLNTGDWANMREGDFIKFINKDLGFEREITVQIKKITYYDNFKCYLESETLERCLPTIDNIENGLKVYYKFYSESDELKYKVIDFTF